MYISLTSTPNRSCELSTIELCARDVSRWFNENALLLNPTQTEAVFFGTRQRLSQLITSQGIDVWYSHPVHGRGQAARGDAGFDSEF